MIRLRPENSEVAPDEVDIRMSRMDLVRLIRTSQESALFNDDLAAKNPQIVAIFDTEARESRRDASEFQQIFDRVRLCETCRAGEMHSLVDHSPISGCKNCICEEW